MHVSCSTHVRKLYCNIADVVLHSVCLHQVESEPIYLICCNAMFCSSRYNRLKFISSVFACVNHDYTCYFVNLRKLALNITHLPALVFCKVIEHEFITMKYYESFAKCFAFLYLKSIIFNLFWCIILNCLNFFFIILFIRKCVEFLLS